MHASKLLSLLTRSADLRLVDHHTQPFQETLDAIKKLIGLCRIYDCACLLRPGVNDYLQQYRKELFLAIKEDPPFFAILATHLRDKSIMTEAYIHLVGTYHEDNWPWKTPKHNLERFGCILGNVKSKAAKLATECAFTSLKLFQNSIHVEENGSIVCVSIQGSQDSWAAVALCRDWLATSLDEADDDPVKKGAVYRKLHKGGDEFLPIWQV